MYPITAAYYAHRREDFLRMARWARRERDALRLRYWQLQLNKLREEYHA